MIYTVTFSPSLDYILFVPDFAQGEVNRTDREVFYPGGKGINVSIMLTNLGVENKALGFVSGFIGRALEQMLWEMGYASDFIRLPEGNTRVNVKLKAQAESDINGQGPDISEECLQELFDKLDELQAGDLLVLAGSIPPSLPQNIYENIIIRIKEKNIDFVVDATNDLLKNVLVHKPFLIKPNTDELGEMFGVQLTSQEDVIAYGKKAREMGARNVLVSMAGDGAVLITEDDQVIVRKPPKGSVVNSVGAGDSMVAGFITGWLNTKDYEEALKLAIAAGSATAFTEWLAKGKDVLELAKRF